jgi:peptide/nickel transport system permease protein
MTLVQEELRTSGVAAVEAPSRKSKRVLRPSLIVAGLFVGLVVLMAAWPGLFASGPDNLNPLVALQGPSAAHIFGTDELGRDTFTRVVWGARTSLFLGVAPVIVAGVVGALWGLLAGLAGAWLDEILMRVADILMSFPAILMALLIVAVLGPGVVNVVIAIAISLLPGFARVIRAQTLLVKNSLYVQSATSLGLRRREVIVRHIAPNVVGPLLVLVTMNIGTSILTASSLSFLGLGAQPPTPEWGAMLSEARNYLQVDWALAVFPGLALTLTVISLSVIGRTLQARFEGRSL